MGEITAWPKATGVPKELPKRIKRPCDWGLELKIMDLETQLGTVEAYNRLVEACEKLSKRIEGGDIKAQNPCYAINPKGGTPS